jgi:hypothetical protein
LGNPVWYGDKYVPINYSLLGRVWGKDIGHGGILLFLREGFLFNLNLVLDFDKAALRVIEYWYRRSAMIAHTIFLNRMMIRFL